MDTSGRLICALLHRKTHKHRTRRDCRIALHCEADREDRACLEEPVGLQTGLPVFPGVSRSELVESMT